MVGDAASHADGAELYVGACQPLGHRDHVGM